MKKNTILTIGAVMLVLLGAYMIYLGTSKNVLPPTFTGIGFLIIAFVFLGLRSRSLF